MRTLSLLSLLLLGGCSGRHEDPGTVGAHDLAQPSDLTIVHYCTAKGCPPLLSVGPSAPVALTAAQIQSSSLEVCRNQECFTTTFASWSPAATDHASVGF